MARYEYNREISCVRAYVKLVSQNGNGKKKNNFTHDDIKDSQNLHNECKA